MKSHGFQYQKSFVCELQEEDPFVVDLYVRPQDNKTCFILPSFVWDDSGLHATMLRRAKELSRLQELFDKEKDEWVIAFMKNFSNNRRLICGKRLEDIFNTYNQFGVPIGFNEPVPMVECPAGRDSEIRAVKTLLDIIIAFQ